MKLVSDILIRNHDLLNLSMTPSLEMIPFTDTFIKKHNLWKLVCDTFMRKHDLLKIVNYTFIKKHDFLILVSDTFIRNRTA